MARSRGYLGQLDIESHSRWVQIASVSTNPGRCFSGQKSHAGNIAARPVEARNKTGPVRAFKSV